MKTEKLMNAILFILLVGVMIFTSTGVIIGKEKPDVSKNEIEPNIDSSNSGTIGGQVLKTGGWADNNTFLIFDTGVPGNRYSNRIARKSHSKREAIINAQNHIIEKFGLNNVSSSENKAFVEQLKAIVNSGQVISEAYDENGNCEIIYKVKADNLKEKVESLNK